MSNKYCPYCDCTTEVIKFGTTSARRQRYRCRICLKSWTAKPHQTVLSATLWDKYIFHNLNKKELAEEYHLSDRTIRNKLDLYNPPEIIPAEAEVIAMDVTYFGRTGGILTVIDAIKGNTLYCEPVKAYETVWDYEKAIRALHRHNVFPKACVVDGKKGVMEMLESYGIKVQMCQFHQLKIITQCLTRKPVLEPNIELRTLSLSITHTNEERFTHFVFSWRLKHLTWLKEKTWLPDGKWEYSHRLTRRAINSLIHHLPYLFTYEKYPELNIPNTNNKIEGIHSELKRRLANHRGLKKEQKIKFARIFLSRRTGV